MSRNFSVQQLLGMIGLLGACWQAQAQSYDISWHAIAGGGGSSTGGVYTVTGTIGQPAAGHLSGGNYSIDGGFWGLLAVVQTPGAPLLSLTIAKPNVVLSWPATATGFYLQQSPDVTVGNGWSSNGLPAVVVNNGSNTVTVPLGAGNQYFRLKQ
jgi:hypothetical protein